MNTGHEGHEGQAKTLKPLLTLQPLLHAILAC